MLNVFEKKSAKELHVQISNGRLMPLEDLVRDYEKLLKEESSKKAITPESKDGEAITQKLEVGKWFLIDRDVIAKNLEKIHRVCNNMGKEGKAYWNRFELSNKIADENPDQYPRIIETYIFMNYWDYKTEQEMRDMCKEIGDGECDEVICDLELQMRICNGESAYALFKEADELPCVRIIQFRYGDTGFFGGGACYNYNFPPASLYRYDFGPVFRNCNCTPYAFRRKFS